MMQNCNFPLFFLEETRGYCQVEVDLRTVRGDPSLTYKCVNCQDIRAEQRRKKERLYPINIKKMTQILVSQKVKSSSFQATIFLSSSSSVLGKSLVQMELLEGQVIRILASLNSGWGFSSSQSRFLQQQRVFGRETLIFLQKINKNSMS